MGSQGEGQRGSEWRPRGSGSKARPSWNCVFDHEGRGRGAGGQDPWPWHAGGTSLVTVYTHTLDVQVRKFLCNRVGWFFTFLIKLVVIDKLPSPCCHLCWGRDDATTGLKFPAGTLGNPFAGGSWMFWEWWGIPLHPLLMGATGL